MIAAGATPLAARVVRWTIGTMVLATLATAIWFTAVLLDSLAVALMVIAALLLPIMATAARPRTTRRRLVRR